jgi:hypothetical protein
MLFTHMRQTVLILSLFVQSLCAAESVDLNRNSILALMLVPETQQAVVSVVDERGQAGFALCLVPNNWPSQCELFSKRFPVAEMPAVRAQFESKLRGHEQSAANQGFEVGTLSALGLNSSQMGVYYGLKSYLNRAVPSATVDHYGQLFNTEMNSPPFVTFDDGGGAITIQSIITALQFSAFPPVQ